MEKEQNYNMEFSGVKISLKLAFIVFLLFYAGILIAQSSVNAGGGNAAGIGGKVSYSTGQLVYHTSIGANGSVAQGVQQPFEISVVSVVKEYQDKFILISVYPNPTAGYLQLSMEMEGINELTFQLYDIKGIVLHNANPAGYVTLLDMRHYPSGVYFIKVFSGNEPVKVFKIIKN